MAEKEPNPDEKDKAVDLAAMLGMGGFLDGVSNLITKFGELAERGETLRQNMGNSASESSPIRTAGQVSIRFGGLADQEKESGSVRPVNAQPSRNRSTVSQTPASPPVPKVREAHVELFEEETHLLLIAEMPGVASQDVQLHFVDKTLTIEGTSQTTQFKSQVELPRAFAMEQVSVAANNGIIEIRMAL